MITVDTVDTGEPARRPIQADAIPIDQLLKLDHQLCFSLYAAARRVTRAYGERLAELDLTYPQYIVLLVLWEWERQPPAHPTVKALGERLELDSGTLTPLLRRLEGKGIVLRERAQADERQVLLRLTRKGKALKRRVARVTLAMLGDSPLSLGEMLELRARLERLRSDAAA